MILYSKKAKKDLRSSVYSLYLGIRNLNTQKGIEKKNEKAQT